MSDTAHLSLFEKMKAKTSFRKQVFVLIFVLLVVQLVIMGLNFHNTLLNRVEVQLGTKAMVQAQEIAKEQSLILGTKNKNQSDLKAVIDRLQKLLDAKFIIVSDDAGVQLFHPNPERIGASMLGLDLDKVVIKQEPYFEVREDELGYAVRAKSPIVDRDGKVVGVVSVGYSLNRFDEWLVDYSEPLLIDFIMILCLTFFSAWVLSKFVKKKMNGMEPSDIALVLYLQKSILRSVYEGVIAIDKKGFILAVNNTARELLGTDKEIKYLRTRRVIEFVSNSQFFFQTPFDENLKDEIISINGKTLIANRVAIFDKDNLIGWVVSFRDKEEMNSLTAELTQIKQYTDNISVMRHEHANKLSTIGNLIEEGNGEAALALINKESIRKQQLTDFVTSRIHCKQVAGILLGKYARAKELGLALQLDSTCQLYNLNERISADELSAVIGNLLDNSFEATLDNPDSNKIVSILISDATHELVIEVKDNGCGISPEIASSIFSRGVTSKEDEDKQGIGLYLINRYVTNAGGVILIDNAEPKGTIFSLFIPNEGGQ